MNTVTRARHAVLIAAVMAAASCSEGDPLFYNECSAQPTCFTYGDEHRGVGECRDGVSVCDDQGKIIGCDGDIGPTSERCDGLDQDCDSQIDEYYELVDELAREKCGSDVGACKAGRWGCYDGTLKCVGEVRPIPETCDGIDENCDNMVDNIEGVEFCYPAEGLPLLPCHPGIVSCLWGTETCTGWQGPTEEIRDGIDNDCDGECDEGFEVATKPVDMVEIIDISHSMGYASTSTSASPIPEMQRFHAFNQRICVEFGDKDVRVAIVTIPGWDVNNVPVLLTDFIPAVQLCLMDGQINNDGLSGEPSYDALLDVATGAIALSWRADSKKIVLLATDEVGQTVPARGTTELMVADAMAAADQMFIGFTLPIFYESFDEIALATGGELYNLASEPDYLASVEEEIWTCEL